MVQDYYAMLKQIRNMRRDYKSLDIDSKLFLLNLELKIEAEYIKGNDFHTKAEKKALKSKTALIRRHNAQKRNYQGK